MRSLLLAVGLLAGLAAFAASSVSSRSAPQNQATPAAQPGQQGAAAQAAKDRSADEAAIRANVAAFVTAYNAGDAKAVASLFTPDGQALDKEGNAVEGRPAIEQTFAELFAETPEKRLEVFVDSIRFLGSDLAVEVGSTMETLVPGEPAQHDRYTVIHVKRDGKWQMALARDAEGEPPTNHERLEPLGWLVGEWVDDGGNVVVFSTCRWSEDRNFLLQDFKLEIAGREAMQVTQRIGWDPLAKRIRSWVFDSEGGYGESVWARNGDAWIIKSTGVRSDGTMASATNLLMQTGTDGYVWRSTDRVVDNEVDPPMEVKVVRKPPPPKP
jgi:uncharacterized protein (TIGR02246 family)